MNDYHNANLLEDDEDDVPTSSYSEARMEPATLPTRDLSDLRLSTGFASQFEPQAASPPPPIRKPPQLPGAGRLVIAIDYGTTYTGLAFATTQSENVDIKDIQVVQKWGAKMGNQHKVRSVISYAAATKGEAQWGSDLSDSAITMVNTKLELEPLATRFDELDLTLQVLTGTGFLEFDHIRKTGSDPAYTTKGPTEIVTDYLKKILESFRREMDVEQLARTKTSVDIVATVPVDWSYEAHKSIFQALRGAGFNQNTFPSLKDTILVTEPEAASYFTSRDLLTRSPDIFWENDCFILCDAGGGTVDVISFQVKKLEPHFVLEKATKPIGGNYGSSLIDTRFKGWLRDTIGKTNYAKIDPANAKKERISPHTVETGPMRKLLEAFFNHKSIFSMSNKSDIKLILPAPLNQLTVDRVKQGELTIPWTEMAKLMDPCVNGVVELIKDQIVKVSESKNRRVRNVFLVGGFGASPYLQEMLRKSLAIKKIKLHRPEGNDDNHADLSLTAVVQGGVIYGIEKGRHKDANYMTAVSKSYGVLYEKRFEWLIKKGDLILSNKAVPRESNSFWLPVQSCVKGKYDFPIYYHLARSDDDDDFPEWWQDGQHDVAPAGIVKCDFSNRLDRDLRPLPGQLMPGTPSAAKSRTSIGPLKWRLSLSTSSIIAEIILNGSPVGKCEIKPESDGRNELRRDSTHSTDSLDAYDSD